MARWTKMSAMTGKDHVNAPVSRVMLTYEDFEQFPDDGKRHELIDGEHYVTPSPNLEHQAISMNLSGMIWSYLQAHPIGRVFAAPFDVVFSNFDVVEPDLLYMSTERASTVLTENTRAARRNSWSRSARKARGSATKRSSVASTKDLVSQNTG